MAYTNKDAQRDAIEMIEGPFRRAYHQSTLRDQVAERLKAIVTKAVDDMRGERR